MTDVQWIYAEGLAMGAEIAEKSMREADTDIEAVFAENEPVSAQISVLKSQCLTAYA